MKNVVSIDSTRYTKAGSRSISGILFRPRTTIRGIPDRNLVIDEVLHDSIELTSGGSYYLTARRVNVKSCLSIVDLN